MSNALGASEPVADSVRVAVSGAIKIAGTDFVVDPTTGLLRFQIAPAVGAVVSAGFLFDTPVRFDTDTLEIDCSGLEAGLIPKIPLVEIQPC